MSKSNNTPPAALAIIDLPVEDIEEDKTKEEPFIESVESDQIATTVEPEEVIPTAPVSNRPEGVPDIVWQAANASVPVDTATPPVPKEKKTLTPWIVGACVLISVVFLVLWLWRGKNTSSESKKPQVQDVSKEKVRDEIPGLDYSKINREEMEKYKKTQPVYAIPLVDEQPKKQKEFWSTFLKILEDEVVGVPPVQKQEAPTPQRTKEEKTENLASRVSPSVVEPPKEQAASKPSVQNDVLKKVSQAPAKKSEKPKVVSKPKQTSLKIQWIPSGKNYIPVKEGNRGFTGSHEPDISKPSGWERAKWRLLGTNDNCYWGLVK